MGFAKGENQGKELLASGGQVTMKSAGDVHRAADMFACTALGDSQTASTKLLVQDLPQVCHCLPLADCLMTNWQQGADLVLRTPASACYCQAAADSVCSKLDTC